MFTGTYFLGELVFTNSIAICGRLQGDDVALIIFTLRLPC